MSETPPTVYLSFTPRDEAAVTRLANALRAAGVAVQLATEEGDPGVEHCDLLVPVISDNTQSQSTGRFRNEWQRGAQRAEAMADSSNFLLPVVIDNTANRDAKVPPAFRGRPWMRQEVWAPTDALVAKVQSMLEKRASAQAAEQAAREAAAQSVARGLFGRWRKRLPPWVRRLRLVWIITLVVLPTGAVVVSWRSEPATKNEPAVDAAGPVRSTSSAGIPANNRPSPPDPVGASRDVGRAETAQLQRERPGPTLDAETSPLPAAEERDAARWTDVQRAPVVEPVPTGPSEFVPVAKLESGGGRMLPSSNASEPAAASRTRAQTDEAPPRKVAEPLEQQSSPESSRSAEQWEAWETDVLVRLGGAAAAPEDGAMPESAPLHARNLQRTWMAYATGQPEVALRALAEVPNDFWVESRLFVGPAALLRAWLYRETGDTAALHDAIAAGVAAVDAHRREREAEPAEEGSVEPDPAEEIALAQLHALAGNSSDAFAAMARYDDATQGRPHAWDGQKAIVWTELKFNPDLIDQLITRFRRTVHDWAGMESWLQTDPRLAAWRRNQP